MNLPSREFGRRTCRLYAPLRIFCFAGSCQRPPKARRRCVRERSIGNRYFEFVCACLTLTIVVKTSSSALGRHSIAMRGFSATDEVAKLLLPYSGSIAWQAYKVLFRAITTIRPSHQIVWQEISAWSQMSAHGYRKQATGKEKYAAVMVR